MADSTRTTDPDLTNLTADFDIVGELGTGPRTQYLIATRKTTPGKRRDDTDRVLVEVVHPPEGDESHALDHLASDTKLLSGLRHRRLVSIVEGRWLGPDAFAVIREYVDDPSVADLLARGNSFTNTRIAAILREVHGVLQWAREQDVVHRHITPDRLFLEPTSDRVRVTFGAGPLQRVRTTDPTTEDVLTVVRLAVAMLTGGISADEAEGRSVAELRPDLPDRLFEETERLLREPATDEELTLYLALIGMADPVAEGETERDRIRAELVEEQRVEREKLAAERADLDRLIAEERQKLAQEGEELRGAFAQDKAKLEREFAAEQRLLAAERVEMQRIITQERAELQAKREAMQRELGERLAEIERAAAEDRAKIEALRAEDPARGREGDGAACARPRSRSWTTPRFGVHTGKYATPAFMAPKLAPFPELVFRDDDRLGGYGEDVRSAEAAGRAVVHDEGRARPALPAPRAGPVEALGGARRDRRRHPHHGGNRRDGREPISGARRTRSARRRARRVPSRPYPRAAPAVTDSSAGGLGVAPDSASVAATDSSIEVGTGQPERGGADRVRQRARPGAARFGASIQHHGGGRERAPIPSRTPRQPPRNAGGAPRTARRIPVDPARGNPRAT